MSNVKVFKSASKKVWTLVINRPRSRNAVDRETALALHRAFVSFEKDQNSKCAVLYGENGTFCAGADLRAFDNVLSPPSSKTSNGRINFDIGPMGPTRLSLSKPVIAAVEGHAVAGGLELACWCDMRVADETATFGVYCRRWGVPLIDGGTIMLPRLIGHSRAMDLILTGRSVDANEAHSIGLVNRLVDKGSARQEAEELAERIASFPQQCVVSDRNSAISQWGMGWNEALLNEYNLGKSVMGRAKDGAARFEWGAGRGGNFQDYK